MSKLVEVYQEYTEANVKYQKLRMDLFRGPEMKAHELAVDLNIYELKRQIESLVETNRKKARDLYSTIYEGEPTIKDLDHFLEIADELMKYEDFVSAEEKVVLRLYCRLVLAQKKKVNTLKSKEIR